MGEKVEEIKITLRDGLKMLLDEKKWADCSFHFAKDGNKKIKAHKLILATASPVFRAMFYGEMANNLAVEIEDIRPEVFNLLLDYIYTEHCNFPESDEIYDLYYAAEKYMLPMLKKLCVEEVMECLSASNACKNYEYAKLFNIPALVRRTEMMILLTETSAVLASESIADVQLSTLLMILDYEELNIVSESELFDAVIRWGRKECERRGFSGESENLRAIVDPALKKIHFLTYTTDEFIKGTVESQIFTDTESISILRGIAHLSANFPVLKRFSAVTEKRRAGSCDRLFPDEQEVSKLEPEVDECNDWPQGLRERFKYLLQSEQFADCAFAVVQEDNDSVKRLAPMILCLLMVFKKFQPCIYKAHRLILSMISPKFRDMWSWNKGNDETSEAEDDESSGEEDDEPSEANQTETEQLTQKEDDEFGEPVQNEDGEPDKTEKVELTQDKTEKKDDEFGESDKTEEVEPTHEKTEKEDGESRGEDDDEPSQANQTETEQPTQKEDDKPDKTLKKEPIQKEDDEFGEPDKSEKVEPTHEKVKSEKEDGESRGEEDGNPGSPVKKEDGELNETETEPPIQQENCKPDITEKDEPIQKEDDKTGGKASDKPIKIGCVIPDTFKCLLDFIYTDRCNLPDSDEICKLALAAKLFRLPLLVDTCVSKMTSIRNTFNAFQILKTLTYLNGHVLEENTFRFILQYASKILMEPSFENIPFIFLRAFLEYAENLNISSEKELFEATIRWGHKECQRRVLPENDKNVRTVIDDALKQIRFLAFTSEEFAEGPAQSDILTESERLHILVNIVDPSTKFPMPEGFSTKGKRGLLNTYNT